MDEPIEANAWVICSRCGKKHQLIPAIDVPVYWCVDEIYKLEEGDSLEIEELEG